MKDEKRQDVNKLVGKTASGEYYWLNNVFEHSDDFKGACGSVFRVITEDQYEEDTSEEALYDRLGGCWQSAVEAGETEMGKQAWVEMVFDCDGDDAIYDLSYSGNGDEIIELYNKELPEDAEGGERARFCECIGGGRCFSKELTFERVYDQAALDLALSYEK